MFKNIFRFLLLLNVLLYGFISSVNAETQPIKIGAILHLSGDLAMQGVAFREGIDLAVTQINNSGGVKGREVRIIYEDTNFNTANVHRAAKKLIEHDKVAAAIISTFHETKTAGPLFEKAKIPLLCLWDSTPELDAMGEYLFSIGTWLPSTGKKTANFAFSKLNTKRAAVISTNREWSLRVGNDFAEIFKALGGDLVFKDAYNPGETDFRSLFLKIKQFNPDVLYAPVDDNIGTFFKQLKEVRLDIPVIQSDNLNQEWIGNLGGVLEGVFQSQSVNPTHKEALEFTQLFSSKYGKEPSQLLFHAWGYDGLNLIAKAMSQYEDSSEGIRKGLYSIKDYPGTIGRITIGPEGSHRVDVSMFEISNGNFKLADG